MKTSIIAIGDELLIGQVTDTNSGSLARIMEPYGWTIDNVAVVHDDAPDIRAAIERAFTRTDVVLTTGGLGPTKDDITKPVLRDIFGGEMRIDPAVTANIYEVFAKRGLKMNALTEQQALVPSSCRVIQNRLGTAPIMWFEKDGKVLVAMPGVPFETIGMFTEAVFPQLRERFHTELYVAHRTIVIVGISESLAAMHLDEWERGLQNVEGASAHLAYLPKPGLIRLRIDVTSADHNKAENIAARLEGELVAQFPDNLLCIGDLTPEEALLEALRERGLTVSTAESCTGGNIAHRITAIAGCSDVYQGSVVSYTNEMKMSLLGVSAESIDAHGVVSEEVVRQMAEGACRACGSSCAIATSGIAGPTGGTPGKPVGTVCMAIATPEGIATFTDHFPGSRDRVIDRTSTTAFVRLTMALKQGLRMGQSAQ